MFQETYGAMNHRLYPEESLIRATLDQAASVRTARRSASLHRGALAGAALAACLCAVPAAAAVWNPAYQIFYQIAPSAAQFFQPVQERCSHQDITMEVSAVHVEGDTAQAYITLSGGSVDETTDLFDSWSFHLPFDQSGNCERVNWDEETGTVTFLCTTQTLDGSPIPAGSKMTFSVRQLLTGRMSLEDTPVELDLAAYGQAAETVPAQDLFTGSPQQNSQPVFFCTGVSGAEELWKTTSMLLPGEALAEPTEGLAITAAGYVGEYFHIQLCRGDATRTDNHARLWLEQADEIRLDAMASVGFCRVADDGSRTDYTEVLFDVAPEDLSRYILYGDFYAASQLTEGLWQVTFPLEETP